MSTVAISDTATSEYAVEISQDAAGNQIVKRYTATELRNIIALDDYRAEIVIECDNGNEYTIPQRTLEDYAAGKPVDIPAEALQCIVAQWLLFVPAIDEHHEGG